MRLAEVVRVRRENEPPETTRDMRAELSRVHHYLNFLGEQGRATASLAECFSRVFILLRYLRIFPPHKKTVIYTAQEERLRYELRVKPFLLLSKPHLPSFEEVDRAIHPLGTIDEFNESREHGDALVNWMCDLRDLIRETKDELVQLLQHVNPKQLFAIGAEDFFKKNLKDTLQSCILLSLVFTKVMDAVQNKTESSIVIRANAPGERHPWWIVPQLHEDKQ